MDNQRLTGVVFAQGWLGSQIENLKPENESQSTIYAQMAEMWSTIDAALDELIRENQSATAKLEAVKQIINA